MSQPKMPELPPLSGAGPLREHMQKALVDASGLEHLTENQLLELREDIDALLPARLLRDINLEVELVRQLSVAMKLQLETLEDQNCPANQKSQVLNAAAAAISALGKLQIDLHSSERLKEIESILIECLQELPTDAQEKFFIAYEAKLG